MTPTRQPPSRKFSLDPDDTGAFRAATELRFLNLEKAVDVGNKATEEVRATVNEIKADTTDIVLVFKSVKGGVRVLGWVGHGLKWLLIFGGFFTALKIGLLQWLGIGGPK